MHCKCIYQLVTLPLWVYGFRSDTVTGAFMGEAGLTMNHWTRDKSSLTSVRVTDCPLDRGFRALLRARAILLRLLVGLQVCIGLSLVGWAAGQAPADSKPLDGITFASIPGHLYGSVKELGSALGASITEDEDSHKLLFDGHPIQGLRHLFDGSGIFAIGDLRYMGATVEWDQASEIATIQYKDATVQVRQGGKRVVVDKSEQSLMAYQGDRIVLRTHVSTGREGHGTPNGEFNAGPAKERMHLSRLYNFAPMPWSVQVDGNVFIHGYTSVPNSPASHGCIRMPLTRGNPAKYFFNWVDVGTPVSIQGSWTNHYAHHHSHFRLAVRRRRHHSRVGRLAGRRAHPRARIAAHRSHDEDLKPSAAGTQSFGIASETPSP
jgi:hypothetical protein